VGSCLESDEQLTAMEWVVFEAATVLAVGTSFGALLLFSQKGNLLIKQVLEFISSFLEINRCADLGFPKP
jgi:hypothetical protein